LSRWLASLVTGCLGGALLFFGGISLLIALLVGLASA
jgi:hypothetical protein